MKKVILMVVLMVLGTAQAFAAEVKDARYDAGNDTLLLTVAHGGGCGEHEFELEFSPMCFETIPLQADAQLKHYSDDPCEAFMVQTVTVSLKGMPCRPALLNIYGDQESLVRVSVPAK